VGIVPKDLKGDEELKTQGTQLSQEGKHLEAVTNFVLANALEEACQAAEGILSQLYEQGRGEQLETFFAMLEMI